MFKRKEKQRFRPLVTWFLLAALPIILLNTCRTEAGFSIQKGSLQQELLDIPVWKPKRVFADNSFFFAGRDGEPDSVR